MRSIGYFRTDDAEGPLQYLERAFLQYCDVNLHQPVRTFEDTGADIHGAYPGYRGMLEYMRESGSSFLIVAPDATHLGNDLESVARSVVELETAGAKVTCSDEELPDPLQNALRNLGVKGTSRARSERIKESMRNQALKGQGLGRPPYGYRNRTTGTLEVMREEAAVVELIYRLYTKDDIGLRLIAQHLNERDIRTRRGGRWNLVSIRDILRNPAYMGTYTRFGLRLPKNHEAIVPAEVFRAAQDATRARRPVGRVANAEPFLLSGLAYCGSCGNKMMGVTQRQSWKRKDGRRARGVYRYYQCQSRNNQSVCGYHTWRAPVLEGTVVSQLRYALQAKVTDPGARREQVQAIWDSRVRNAERRFPQAMRRAARGEMSVATLGRYLDEFDRVRAGARNAERTADAGDTLADWDSLSLADRQSLLISHIARIVVNDETVEVVV